MTSYHKLNNIFFLILLSITPISIIVGPAVSLIITLLLGLNFILIYFKKNFFYLFKDRTLLILMTLYVYLIFNSFISTDFDIGFKRNFGFVRYIILFLAINYFIKNSNYLNIILKIWILIFSILLFDIFYEFYNGQNILGFISENKKRIVSFFKDEQVVGAFLNGFIFIIIGFLFQKFEKKKKLRKIFNYFICCFYYYRHNFNW